MTLPLERSSGSLDRNYRRLIRFHHGYIILPPLFHHRYGAGRSLLLDSEEKAVHRSQRGGGGCEVEHDNQNLWRYGRHSKQRLFNPSIYHAAEDSYHSIQSMTAEHRAPHRDLEVPEARGMHGPAAAQLKARAGGVRRYLWSPCTTSAAHTATTICMLTHSTAQMRIDCGGKGLNWAISWFVVWTIWQKNSNRFHSHATDSRSLCTEAEIDSCANQETESYHSKEAKITTYLASGSGIKKSIDLWLGLCVQEWVMTCPSERLSSKKKKKRCGKNDLHVGRGVWVKTWGRNQTEPSKL